MNQLTATFPIQISFSDVDSLGIVWHGHYIKYFEFAREAFAKKHHIDYLTAKAHGFALPIVKTNTEHKLTLKYGQKSTIKVELIPKESAKIVYRYTIYNEDNQVVCLGETTQVFTHFETNELALVFPEYYKTALKQMLND